MGFGIGGWLQVVFYNLIVKVYYYDVFWVQCFIGYFVGFNGKQIVLLVYCVYIFKGVNDQFQCIEFYVGFVVFLFQFCVFVYVNVILFLWVICFMKLLRVLQCFINGLKIVILFVCG